ncbi:NAD(P)H-dependent flavin oxidoreductase, partial [Chloroflexota bacterium]
VAALALGAEGIQMRTRFVATRESIAHQKCKEALVKAEAVDTVVFLRGMPIGPFRALKNRLTTKIVERENQGASMQEIAAMRGYDKARQGMLDGDVDDGFIWYGLAAGQIREIIGAGEVVRSIIDGAEAILNGL